MERSTSRFLVHILNRSGHSSLQQTNGYAICANPIEREQIKN